MKSIISIRIDDNLKTQIEELSRLMKVRKSDIIREALSVGLKVIASRIEEQEKIRKIVDEMMIKNPKIIFNKDISIVDLVSRERDENLH